MGEGRREKKGKRGRRVRGEGGKRGIREGRKGEGRRKVKEVLTLREEQQSVDLC